MIDFYLPSEIAAMRGESIRDDALAARCAWCESIAEDFGIPEFPKMGELVRLSGRLVWLCKKHTRRVVDYDRRLDLCP